ncbi:MAG: hypothetical protein U0Z44_03080 [Kouleothrix sp.]
MVRRCARDLFGLRTIEDLFVVIATLADLPPTRAALQLLTDTALRASTLEPALTWRARLYRARR